MIREISIHLLQFTPTVEHRSTNPSGRATVGAPFEAARVAEVGVGLLIRGLLLGLFCLGGLAAAEGENKPTTKDSAAIRDLLRAQDPPWYDSQRDSWRRIEIPAPPVEKVYEPPQITIPSVNVSVLAWALLAALVVAVTIVLWRLISERQMAELEDRAARSGPATAPVRVAHLPFAPRDEDPDQAFAKAMAAGDWAGAAVWVYVRTLLALDRHQVLRLERGATNRIHRVAVHRWAGADIRRSQAPVLIDAIVAAFEAVYFGRQPMTRAEVEQLDWSSRELIAAAKAAAATEVRS